EGAGNDAVLSQPDHEHRAGAADRVRDRLDPLGRVEQPGLAHRVRFRLPQALARGGSVIARRGLRRRRAVAVLAYQVLADGVLEVRVALEAELLAELDHARLADLQRVGQLLG